jgi:hypothetical protein
LKAQHHCHLKETISLTKTSMVLLQTLENQGSASQRSLTIHNQSFKDL